MQYIRNLIIDMDGVLWHGDTPLPNLPDFFTKLAELDINFVLATNNATKMVEQYVNKFAGFGIRVSPEQIVTSAETTADYLQETYAADTAIYVIGGAGLSEGIARRGFRMLSIADVLAGRRADVVAVGLTLDITYEMFSGGTLCLNDGARLIGSNPDLTFPSEYGNLPGAGSFAALLQAATGVEPTFIGKPGPLIFREALRRLSGTPADTVMVGDRLDTDIEGAHAAGLQTVMVLTGISNRQDIAGSNGRAPDYVCADIHELARRLEAAQDE